MADEQREQNREDSLRPVLRVVRGEPSPEELAALITVLMARTAPEAATGQPRSAWTDRSRLVRRTMAPGPGTWRASAWPS